MKDDLSHLGPSNKTALDHIRVLDSTICNTSLNKLISGNHDTFKNVLRNVKDNERNYPSLNNPNVLNFPLQTDKMITYQSFSPVYLVKNKPTKKS